MTRHLNLNLQIKFQINSRNKNLNQIIFKKMQIKKVLQQNKIKIINH